MLDSLRFRMHPRVRFESMYRAHGAAVRAFARRRLPAAAADDVVSDVFLAAWRRLDEAREDDLAWLLGIARGAIANRRRGDRRQRALHERLVFSAERDVEPQPGPEPELGGSRLLHALATLSERDQEVLRLVAWDGLDRTRAAQVLGISPSLFSLRLHRARRRLARALSRQHSEDREPDCPSSLEALQ